MSCAIDGGMESKESADRDSEDGSHLLNNKVTENMETMAESTC